MSEAVLSSKSVSQDGRHPTGIVASLLYDSILNDIEKFYADPKNMREFEEWYEKKYGKPYRAEDWI